MTFTTNHKDSVARKVAFAALFGALTFLASLLRIPVGPVPITLQTLVVLLAGLVLKPGTAFWAMCVHLALQLVTAAAVWMLPSFGFIIAFIVVAPMMAVAKRRMHQTWTNQIALVVAATFALYLIGIPYMAYILNVQMGNSFTLFQILEMGMLLFLPGDAIKAFLAVLMAKRIRVS